MLITRKHYFQLMLIENCFLELTCYFKANLKLLMRKLNNLESKLDYDTLQIIF